MTTLTFPALGRNGPSAWSWGKRSTTQAAESPFTGSVQTLALPGAKWMFAAAWENLQSDDAALMRAFIAALRGTAGRFYMPNYEMLSPRGTAAGTPLVSGADQTGLSLVTDGWTPGATLLAGDYVGINQATEMRELRMLTAAATADGSGNMTLVLDEPIRVSPADGSAIITAAPLSRFRLASDETEWPYLAGVTSFSIQAIESWN